MNSRWLVLLLLPFLAHALVVSTVVWQEDPVTLGWLDHAVLGLTFAWLGILAVILRRGKSPAKLLLASWSVLLAVLACEGAVRLLYPEPPPGLPWPPIAISAPAADTMKGVSGRIDFTVNSFGVRGPEVDLDDMDLRILCVGGSTTQCRYVTDAASWPWKLQDELAPRLGRRVFVGNAGKPGHMTAEHDRLLQDYALAPRFDWVIALCGINDANVSVAGNHDRRLTHPELDIVTPPHVAAPWYAYYRGLGIVRLLRALERRIRSDSLVQDDAGEWYRDARRQRRDALARQTLTAPPDNLPDMLDDYRQDLRNLIATCRRLELKLVLLTQPTRFEADLPPEVAETFIVQHHEGAYTPDAYAKIMRAFNETLLEVAEDEGVPAIDLANMLPKDGTVFYDECHFNISGCAQVAAILVEFFEEREGQPAAGVSRPRGGGEVREEPAE
ncbi:MAG: SGNH/GDSL hydrolase family protein [Planctomycetales bacterium]